MTRRTVLAAGAVLAAGCEASAPRRRRSAPNPDAAALTAAVRGEAQLLASYDAAIARSSGQVLARLRVGRAAHAVHLSALQRAAGMRSPSGAADSVAHLASTLATSADRLAAAAAAAQRGTTAALFASVSGSHRAMSLTTPRDWLQPSPSGAKGARGARGGRGG